MASSSFNANGYVMGSRIPIRDVNPVVPPPTRSAPLRIASRIIRARAEECTGSASQCEKPVNPSTLGLPIALGVAVPLVGALFLLFYFHRRNMKKQAQEDLNDPNRGLDFGLGDASSDKGGNGKAKRKSMMFREKGMGVDTKKRQLSMDMNLSSPYLLPPGLQSSRESLHSLARTLHNNEDPYRPVAQYTGSEVGSIRSFKPEGSMYSRSTSQKRGSSMTQSTLPPRHNSLPRPPRASTDPFATPKSRSGSPAPEILSPTSPMVASPVIATPTSPAIRSPLIAEPIIPQIETVPYPDDRTRSSLPQIPDLPEPAPVARKGLPSNPRPPAANPPAPEAREADTAPSAADLPGPAKADQAQAPSPSQPAIGLGLDDVSFSTPTHRSSPPAGSLPSSPRPRKDGAPSTLPAIVPEETNVYNDRYDQKQDHDYDFEERGRSQRRSVEVNDHRESRQLGIPAQDNKRLSVGFRPLPPDEVMESEDPEERANRIRSFYKEYFDPDNPNAGGQQPPPRVPPMGPRRGAPPQGRPQYYEDVDPSYMGGPGGDAYFDPETNSFVMPYAQPVTRRAMTPPPNASRFRGPPPPRVIHGSMGGRMASPGPGPRGRGPPPPRAGSAMSSRLGPSRRGSDMSSQYTPRPGSSMSNRMGPRQKPRGPPPADLTTLPNPSKLKDDSFAINPLDFAPPETFADRARGRSQSPAGERRPFAQPKVIHSPLVSSFEDMPAMPSPHLLRKSGTFTGLDFAPPRKFRDNDNMSDAGSIRSNRSGISAVNQAAIRSGAGRVSRLPGDAVFTPAALQDQLKPSWDMTR
ncbi:hypothetical protein CTRI78_v003361 [Colletotrichum trifolii]|uniref:Uncharacterized protein n=1 Tax=Colletotrichum trifolii TaxID=5466 RepID=A0A4R8RJN1_COLTR|nr:hypothetical protein CTRI78_v003361 [Colletotrichum trifolii]